MNCYRCQGTLDLKRDTCPKCGTDVRFFKKIVFMSNRYYNDGLMKAEARDLTGAKESLKTSLSLYKKNTQARNLLGLVYYATGESAEALKMWVISKNYEPEKNTSDRYMNLIRRNMNSLDSEDHGIKKFNQALGYAGNDAKDLAVIQLKKVVSVHSNMTKAYELLALLYIDDGKYDQARKVLNSCLSVDRGNTKALYYLKELDKLENGSSSRSVGTVGEDEREQFIIPVRFRDFGSYLANALYIIAGVLLGIAIAWFVIVPGKVKNEMTDASRQAASYEAEISDLQQAVADASRRESESERVSEEDVSISEEESESESVSQSEEQSRIAEERESMPVIKKQRSYAGNNEAVIRAGGLNTEEDRADFIRTFLSVDPEQLSSDSLVLYDVEAKVLCNYTNRQSYIEEAEKLLIAREYEKGADLYAALSFLMPDEAEIRYRTAEAYELSNDQETAANYYWQYYWLFPDEDRAKDAYDKYLSLTGKEEIDPWQEDLDKEAMIQPIYYEDLVAGLDIPETEPPEETEGIEESADGSDIPGKEEEAGEAESGSDEEASPEEEAPDEETEEGVSS